MLFRRPPVRRGIRPREMDGPLVFYYDGRCSADVAFDCVALNMTYRRRSVEQSGRFLKSHVEDAPANAAEIQDKLRAGGVFFIDRIRHFGGGVLREKDAHWADRSDDVGAWLRYHVENGAGVPTLFITGRCVEFHWPELLGELEGAYISRLAKSRTSEKKSPGAIRLRRTTKR